MRVWNFSKFQSTLPVRGATRFGALDTELVQISIHAPRKGSDFADGVIYDSFSEISIHAPRKGSDT